MGRSPFERALRVAIAVSMLGTMTAASFTTSARERSRPSGGGRVAPRSAPLRPAARSASRPSPRPRVANGTATFGHRHRGSHFVTIRPFFWYPWWEWGYWGSEWWGWPYVYPYYPPRPYPYEEGTPAEVEIDVVPSSAVIEIDGEEVGRGRDYNGAWDRLETSPGRHVISISSPGYKTLEVQIEASPGSYYRLDYQLEKGEGLDARSNPRKEAPRAPAGPPTERGGFLKLRVQPEDAAVYLDGEFLARAGELTRLHGALPVAPGTHRVEAVRPGYRTQSQDITVEDGGRSEVVLELKSDF
jgi:PEGA domain-containing protein